MAGENLSRLLDFHGRTVLHAAGEGGSLASVQYLVDDVSIDTGAKDHDGYCPVHAACQHGHEDIVKWLVTRMQTPDIPDGKGCGALHYAAGEGNKALVLWLIERGSDLRRRNYRGRAAFHWAQDHSQKEVLQLMLKQIQTMLGDSTNDVQRMKDKGRMEGFWTPKTEQVFRQLKEEKAAIETDVRYIERAVKTLCGQ